ncbi:MAG: phosphoribosyltransferase family protein [Actinocatenispora sp.]
MFRDRGHAGKLLVHRLAHIRPSDAIILGVARGGVPVAYEISCALSVPLDVIVVRRLTVPQHSSLTVGAVTEDGIRTPDHGLPWVRRCGPADTASAETWARTEVARMTQLYRDHREAPRLDGRTAVVVDDAVISTATAWASCRSARARGAERVVFAAPMIAPDAVACLAQVCDEVTNVVAPLRVSSTDTWYEHCPTVTDDEVLLLLRRRSGLQRATRRQSQDAVTH